MKFRIFIIIALAAVFGFGIFGTVQASDDDSRVLPQENQPDVVYFFWGDGCPHCEAAKPFLENLVKKYPSVELRSYEVWNNDVNRNFFTQVMAAHDAEPRYVPVIFIGDRYWEGYREDLNSEIESELAACVGGNCPDAARGIALPAGGQSSNNFPWPLVVGLVVVVVAGGGYVFYNRAQSKEKQRLRKIAAKQNKRRKQEG